MKDKKVLVVSSMILLVVIAIAITTNIIKKDNEPETSFEGNMVTSSVKLQEIEFRSITKEYENGVTTIRADVYNDTKETKDINVKIVLKDESGKELTSMIQTFEQIEPGRKKVLQTGIMGNYSNVKDIEFKVLSIKEIEKINE